MGAGSQNAALSANSMAYATGPQAPNNPNNGGNNNGGGSDVTVNVQQTPESKAPMDADPMAGQQEFNNSGGSSGNWDTDWNSNYWGG